MTHDEFCELEAYDRVMPLDHTPRMLGLLAYMVGKYLEFDPGEADLRRICMPWLPELKETSEGAIASMSPISTPVKTNE